MPRPIPMGGTPAALGATPFGVPGRSADANALPTAGQFGPPGLGNVISFDTPGGHYWTVPPGIFVIRAKGWGTAGGSATGGYGGSIFADFAVIPDEELFVVTAAVTGTGGGRTAGAGPGGGDANATGTGGGSTQLWRGDKLLMVAGAGGGGSGGGGGGGLTGTDGSGGAAGGKGGGQSYVDNKGDAGGGITGSPGTRLAGGAGNTGFVGQNGGGGSGYFGGGGGAGVGSGSAGGGGSSWADPLFAQNIVNDAATGSTPGNNGDSDRLTDYGVRSSSGVGALVIRY